MKRLVVTVAVLVALALGQTLDAQYFSLEQWLEVAERGDSRAQTTVGRMYASGTAAPEDTVEAVRWYRLAAEQDYGPAQIELGFMYEQGRGVLQDYSEAIRWYQLAADRGHVSAQKKLGMLYEQGRGVPQDSVEANRRYDLAAGQWLRLAEQGVGQARYNLGILYEEGRGVPRDDAEAARWYGLAAEQGVQGAQNNLGLLYARGIGSGASLDLVEAYRWLYISVASSFFGAKELKDRQANLDRVGTTMTAGQRATATRLANEWLDRKPIPPPPPPQ
jgi:TPR repeat protein